MPDMVYNDVIHDSNSKVRRDVFYLTKQISNLDRFCKRLNTVVKLLRTPDGDDTDEGTVTKFVKTSQKKQNDQELQGSVTDGDKIEATKIILNLQQNIDYLLQNFATFIEVDINERIIAGGGGISSDIADLIRLAPIEFPPPEIRVYHKRESA